MALFTQDQVSNWFAQNPNATPELVAKTVQSLGGLEANQGLAGLLAKQYGTDANTITSGYNALIPPVVSAPAAPVVNAPAAPIAAPVVNAPAVVTPPVAQTPQLSANETAFRAWSAANPGADNLAVARQALKLGLTPQQAILNPGANPLNTLRSYAQAVPYAEMQNLYDKGDYTGINSLLAKNKYTPEQLKSVYGLDQNLMDQIRGKGVNLGYTTPEVQSMVSDILGDSKLNPFEQINKILETGQAKGIDQTQFENIYGKPNVDKALGTYKTGINDFLTQALSKEAGTTMNEVGAINKAAQKYGLTPDEIAKYGGIDTKTAQSYFDMYNKGLGNIVTGLLDPKTDEVTKTVTALAMAQNYGTTDAELAKASNGKFTEKDVKAYLDPVRNVPTGLQKLMDDPKASAADITKFINSAKADPRAAGIYGVGLDKILAASPELVMRDIQNETGSLAENYQTFLDKAKSTPENAAKYAPQIQAVEKMIGTAMFSANEVYGGKPQDYQLQIVSPLSEKARQKMPQQLEMTPERTEIIYGSGDGGTLTEDQRIIPATVKTKGVSPVGGGSDAEGGVIPVTGYKADKPITVNGLPVYAEYDTNGKLTGYVADSSYASWQNGKQYISGAFDANGKPKPRTTTSQQAGFKGVAQDVMGAFNDMGILGQLALMYATGGAGSALAAEMGGSAVAKAVASGLISGALSEVGGGDFGKGFLGGAAGSGVGSLVQGAIPTNITGNTFIDSYLTKAGPSAASSAARTGVMGGNALDAGLYSLLNTGVGMGVNAGTNMLLGEAGLDKLGAAQPYATGIASNLLSGAITGKDFDINKAITNTATQQLLNTGKTAIKSATAP